MMPNRRRRRYESTRAEGHARVAKQPSLEKQQRQQRGGLRIRVEGRRICGKRVGGVNFGSFIIAVILAGLAGCGTGGANAQFIDGGAIIMDCGVCSCDGSSDDGTIEVFDNPSSGERVSEKSVVRSSSRRLSAEMNELYGRFLRFLYCPRRISYTVRVFI